jgi:hypothetical protein
VHFICNEKIIPQLYDKSIVDKIKTVPDNFGMFRQFKIFADVKKYLKQNQIKHIIIGTTEIRMIRNFSFYLRKLNTTGIVHNAKKFEKRWTSKRITFWNIDKFILLGKNLFNNINPIAKYNINCFSPVYFPPVKKLHPVKPENNFWIIVPGGVEQCRRDYISFLQNLDKIELSPTVKIIFLGFFNKEKEQEVYHSLQALKNNKSRIITFEHFVDYDTFHSYLQQANIVLPLFKLNEDNQYVRKVLSGSIPLGIVHKKPFLVPVSYSSHADINQYAVFYTCYNELFSHIQNMVNGNNIDKEIKENYEKTGLLSETEKEADRLFDFICS